MNNERHEEQRILVAAAMLATIVGLMAIFTQSFMTPLRLVLGLSGLFLFLHLIATAAELKYKNKGDLAMIAGTNRIRPYLFDWGISIYGLAILGSLLVSVLYKGASEKVFEALINEDTISGWVALTVAIVVYIGVYFCAHVAIRIWALIKFRRWFWRTKAIREHQENVKRSSA